MTSVRLRRRAICADGCWRSGAESRAIHAAGAAVALGVAGLASSSPSNSRKPFSLALFPPAFFSRYSRSPSLSAGCRCSTSLNCSLGS